MEKYILLLRWTDQGIKNVKDTIKRPESFKASLIKKSPYVPSLKPVK